MDNKLAFILKIFVPSTIVSVLIKSGGPALYLPATATNALIAVFLPTTFVAALLVWRLQQQHSTDADLSAKNLGGDRP